MLLDMLNRYVSLFSKNQQAHILDDFMVIILDNNFQYMKNNRVFCYCKQLRCNSRILSYLAVNIMTYLQTFHMIYSNLKLHN